MAVEIARRLLEWGEEIGADDSDDVIAVEFSGSGRVRATRIGVRKEFSHGALVPQLIAMAFNFIRTSEIGRAVEASGVPCTFVHSKLFERSSTSPQSHVPIEMMATVIFDDGKTDRVREGASNHQAVELLSRITRRPVIYVDVRENIERQSMRELGMPASLIEGLLERGSVLSRRPGGPATACRTRAPL